MTAPSTPFGLSLSKPPRVLSLSKEAFGVELTLRHGAFDKLSPLLRANGWG